LIAELQYQCRTITVKRPLCPTSRYLTIYVQGTAGCRSANEATAQDESYFWENSKPPTDVKTDEVLTGVLDIIANMSVCIPAYETAAFGALEGLSKFAFPSDKKPRIRLAETLKSTLQDAFDEHDSQQANHVCQELSVRIQMVRTLGMFDSADWSKRAEYKVS